MRYTKHQGTHWIAARFSLLLLTLVSEPDMAYQPQNSKFAIFEICTELLILRP